MKKAEYSLNGTCQSCGLLQPCTRSDSSGNYVILDGYWIENTINPQSLVKCATKGCPGYTCFQEADPVKKNLIPFSINQFSNTSR